MFAKFARFISRYWIGVLVAWVVIPVVLYFVAPKWDDITHDGDFAYLPPTLTSVRGEELLEKDFPGDGFQEQCRAGGRPARRRTHRRRQGRRRPAGGRCSRPSTAKDRRSLSVMTHEKEIVGQKLVSRDGQWPGRARGLAVEHRVHGRRQHGVHRRDLPQGREMQKETDFPPGCKLGVTGSAAVGSDML